ncbi:MAG TPA: hypothetical protein VF493_09575 [Terriglobales bacterium]
MKIAIRPADLKEDKDLLIATLGRYLTSSSNEERFRWLYERNPHGPTRAWLAQDTASGATVGASAAFPRKIAVNGSETTGWVLGDFCIADDYRSLGPALQLQKATLAAVDELREATCCYDFPSRQLTATYRRMGINPVGQLIRFARPLRLDSKLQQLIKPAALARPASWIANSAMRIRDLRIPRGPRLNFEIHKSECGPEFTQLADAAADKNGIQVKRSADHLNWRYLQHPFVQYEILTARKQGDLQGYLVFSSSSEHAQVAEWCAASDDIAAALINESVRRLRKTNATVVSTWLLDKDPRSKLLKEIGFWPRESTPVMVYWAGSESGLNNQWLFMYGDRDS